MDERVNESECVHIRMYVVPFYVKKRMVCKRKINTAMPRHCEWKRQKRILLWKLFYCSSLSLRFVELRFRGAFIPSCVSPCSCVVHTHTWFVLFRILSSSFFSWPFRTHSSYSSLIPILYDVSLFHAQTLVNDFLL